MKTEPRLTQPNEDQPVTSSLQFDVIVIELQTVGFGFVQFKPDLVSKRAGSTFSHFAPFKYYRNVAPLIQRIIVVSDWSWKCLCWYSEKPEILETFKHV